MTRRDHTFLSGGQRCAARLHTPDGAGGVLPCVVMAHGMDGAGSARLEPFAERFAAEGVAALVFDYRHFGDSEGEPRGLLDLGAQLDDWRAALNFARMLHGIDPHRVGLWGTAISAGHVVTVAAEDPDVAAVISQAPFLDGLSALHAAGLRTGTRLALADVRDQARRLVGRSPAPIPLVGPPGSLAAMTGAAAETGYDALFADGGEPVNQGTARGLLRLAAYRPRIKAAEVGCPWLVCVCDKDSVVPPGPALKAAARAPRGEIRHYEAGHFDVYVGPTHEIALADQADFLRRHLIDQK